ALSGPHTVGIDGTISVPDVGAVALGGMTSKEANKAVETALSKILAAPKVTVVIVASTIEVTVLGEVGAQGKHQLKSGDGVAEAIAMAGGMGEFGNPTRIFLVRSGEPRRIRFRMKGLLRGGDSARKFALQDGDLIVVE